MRKIAPSEKLEQGFFASLSESEKPLSEAARRGAQLMLQRALEIEVNEFLGRERYERSKDEHLMGYRNGYEPKTVPTAEGSFVSQIAQIRDGLAPFESLWLKTIGKRSESLLELIPLLYVKGMSQRDIESAMLDALNVEKTGRSVVNAVCRKIRPVFE